MREPHAPWCLRVSEHAGWSPPRLSLALAAALGSAFVATEGWLGRIELLSRDAHVAVDFQVALGLIALLAYTPGAFAAAVRGSERTLKELAPAFTRPREAAAAADSVTGRWESPWLRRLGAIGTGVGLLIPFATNWAVSTWFLWELPPEAVVHRLLLGPVGWFTARSAAVIGAESRRLAALGAGDVLRVDLMDLRPLAPLARAGIRHALLGAGALSVLGIGFHDTSVAPGLPFVVALAVAANVAFSVLALWLALRGGHAAIQREKERATAAANVALRALREPGAKHTAGALADALAWKRFVAEAPDWPIDLPALQRFVLPLALPVASLLAGAFLDVLLERLMPG